MKTLALLILFCASVYGADTTTTTNIVGDITTKVFERTAKDGKPKMRTETVYRGGKKILQTVSQPNEQGKLVVVYRRYLVNGNLVMSEYDNDGRGGFKSLFLYQPGTDNLEIFHPQPDGTVKPVSTKHLELIKKQGAVMTEYMEKEFAKTNETDQEICDSMQQMRQKVQDMEKEKKNDTK
jgi:hypothetical protein